MPKNKMQTPRKPSVKNTKGKKLKATPAKASNPVSEQVESPPKMSTARPPGA